MKVILLDELKGRGGEGDVIDVRQGYAENYLYPKKIAIPATKGNLKQLEQRKHNIAKREEARIAKANEIYEATEGQRIEVKAKVGEDGQLFGSVTTTMIAEALQEQLDVEIDRRKIETHGAIKTAGAHVISLIIYRDINSQLTLVVQDSEGVYTPEDKEAKETETTAEAKDEASDESEAQPEEQTEEPEKKDSEASDEA